MNLVSEKASIKKGIDQVTDKNVLQAIKTLLDYSNVNTDKWDDEEFVKELQQRSNDYRSGKVKTYSLKEVEVAARKSRKRKA